MGKTRSLSKKIRDTKEHFMQDKGQNKGKRHTIKDRNDMDLTEAEEIKTTWQ